MKPISIDNSTFGNSNQLKGFVEIYQPSDVSMFPETIGWKLLLVILVLVGIFSIHLFNKRRQKWKQNAYRREALAILDQLNVAEMSDSDFIQQFAVILKGTALFTYPRETVSDLTGSEWLAFVNRQTATPCFDTVTTELLVSGVYQEMVIGVEMRKKLINSGRRWVMEHSEEVADD